MQITLETAEGKSVSTNLVGFLRLVLTYDSNTHDTYETPDCVYDPQSPINILGIPCLGKNFKDGVDIRNLLDEDGTTVKSGSTKSHFIWDHGKNERNLIHGSSQLPELVLYVGHGYFSAFCTCVHKLLGDKVHYAFSSAYSTAPKNVAQTTPDPHVIPYKNGDLDPEDPIHQWYTPETDDKVSKAAPSINKTPIPKQNVSWSNDTKLPTPNCLVC